MTLYFPIKNHSENYQLNQLKQQVNFMNPFIYARLLTVMTISAVTFHDVTLRAT